MILSESIRRIKELFPSGSQDLYDWDTTKAWFFGFFNGLGAIAKEAVIDPVEALPAELCPATTTNLAPEWEDALGLANTTTAQLGTIEQRRAAILSFLRMSGTFALDDIRAILQPYFLYADASQIEILEADRGAQRTAHTYAGVAIGPAPLVSDNVIVSDDPRVSPAGVILQFEITTTRLDSVVVTLRNPAGVFYQRLAGFLDSEPTSVTAEPLRIVFPEFARAAINGQWRVEFFSASGANITIGSWSLFVEGLGNVYDANGDVVSQGLGAAIFNFVAVADLALVGAGYDVEGAQRALTRWKPAHTQGGITTTNASGNACAIPNTPNAIPNNAIPC